MLQIKIVFLLIYYSLYSNLRAKKVSMPDHLKTAAVMSSIIALFEAVHPENRVSASKSSAIIKTRLDNF